MKQKKYGFRITEHREDKYVTVMLYRFKKGDWRNHAVVGGVLISEALELMKDLGAVEIKWVA